MSTPTQTAPVAGLQGRSRRGGQGRDRQGEEAQHHHHDRDGAAVHRQVLPTFGLFVTSLRPEEDINSSGWWTAFTNPLSATTWTLENYQGCGAGARHRSTSRSSTARAVAIPATILPIMVAAFAAYAFTFMEFPGRDWIFVAFVALLSCRNGRARPAAPVLRPDRAHRHLPSGLARPRGLRHAIGGLHPAQLHGDASTSGHRVGEDRRRKPLRHLLAAHRADVRPGARVVRDLPVPVGVERPARRAGVPRVGREHGPHGEHQGPCRAAGRAPTCSRPRVHQHDHPARRVRQPAALLRPRHDLRSGEGLLTSLRSRARRACRRTWQARRARDRTVDTARGAAVAVAHGADTVGCPRWWRGR